MAVKGLAQLTVVDLTDGYTVNTTRDSYIFTGDVNGNVAAQETFSVQISALQGSTTVPCSVNTSAISLPSAGLTVTSDNHATSPTLTFVATTALTDAVLSTFGGLIAIPILVNNDVTITKGLALAVAEKGGTGSAGAAAYNYTLIVSPNSVVQAEGGTRTPTSITLSATRGQGTGTPSAYSGRFKVEMYRNSAWSTKYTSSGNESSKSYTLATDYSDYTLIRCSLYLAGGTSTLLDQQTVPIVSEGDTGPAGADAYTVILTNESHTFPAGVTNALASSTTTEVLAYKGSTAVTPTIGTISGQISGKLTATPSGTTITISATTSLTQQSGVLTIPVTVDGKTFNKKFSWSLSYKGDQGIQGIQGIQGESGEDAIVVAITSSNGTVFKNNSGSTTLTAHVYVGGASQTISSNGSVTINGTTYVIKWYKDGVYDSSADSVTVSAQNIQSTSLYSAQLETTS